MYRLTRRSFLAATGMTMLPIAARAQSTPTAKEDALRNPVFYPDTSAGDPLLVDTFRVLPNQVEGGSVVGSLYNPSRDLWDAPSGLMATVRDLDGVIVDSGFALFNFPVIPAGERIGFEAWALQASFDEIDPAATTFSLSLGDAASDLIARDWQDDLLQLVSWDILGANGDLVIEAVVKNTGKRTLENGIDPRFAVWTQDGLYCGAAFANVFSPIGEGESVRFTTNSIGGLINPMQFAGEEYEIIPRIAPR